MIAIPVTVICAAQVVLASADVSPREQLDLRLAGNQAVLTRLGEAFSPTFDGVGSTVATGDQRYERKGVPGWGDRLSSHASALSRLLNRPVAVETIDDLQAGPRRVGVSRVGVDPGQPGTSAVMTLLSGRFPQRDDEVMVTEAGLAAGLPDAGRLSVFVGLADSPRTLTVVGTAQATLDETVALAGLPQAVDGEVRFLIGGGPLDWDEAVDLARYGFVTGSRAIADDPPSAPLTQAQASRAFYNSLLTAGAFTQVALLIAPAFAIGAGKRRRHLALVAMNGGDRTQLRRIALGQGALLGVTAAACGLGIGVVVGVVAWSAFSADPSQVHGPLEVPPVAVTLVGVLGVATPLVAALLSARGLSRLDLVSALRGTALPPTPGPRRTWLGVAAIVVGIGLVWLAPQVLAGEGAFIFWLWCGGAGALVAGSLLLVPTLLTAIAAGVRHSGAELRMAARDAARQGGRAVATLAAVLTGGLILSVLWTIVLSFDANAARGYRPDVPVGQATIEIPSHPSARPQRLAAAIEATSSSLHVAEFGQVSGWGPADEPGVLAVVGPGCDPAEVADEPPRQCRSLSTSSSLLGAAILVGEFAELTSAFGLDDDQQATLREGGILVNTATANGADPRWSEHSISKGTVVIGEYGNDGTGSARLVTLPAAGIDSQTLARAAAPTRFGALVTTATASERRWVTGSRWLQVIPVSGAIRPTIEQQLVHLASSWDPAATVRVERGYTAEPQPLLWLATGVAIVLAVIAAALATTLSVGQMQPFLRTLTAVGAAPTFTRRFAAIQAAGLAFIGTALGCLSGVLVAAPLVIAVTGRDETSPTLAIPHGMIAGLLILTPAVAALVAVGSARSAAVDGGVA